jgi:hypothetical protein
MEKFGICIWNILRPFGILYGRLVIKWQFDIFSPILVYCVEKNLAALLSTLVVTRSHD